MATVDVPQPVSSTDAAITAALAAHDAAADPHTPYLKESEAGAPTIALPVGDPVPGGTAEGTIIIRY